MAHRIKITEEELREAYCKRQLSITDTARLLHVSPTTIRCHLKQFNIVLREKPPERIGVKAKCVICDREFYKSKNGRLNTYCSDRCRRLAWKTTSPSRDHADPRYRGLNEKRAKFRIPAASELDTITFHSETAFLDDQTFHKRMYATGEKI